MHNNRKIDWFCLKRSQADWARQFSFFLVFFSSFFLPLFFFFSFLRSVSCLNQTVFTRVVTMRVENGWASSWRRRWRWCVRARWWRWMGLLRGRQHLGIVALLADFILQGGGWSADEVFQFVRRQHREVSVCEKISPVLLMHFTFFEQTFSFHCITN